MTIFSGAQKKITGAQFSHGRQHGFNSGGDLRKHSTISNPRDVAVLRYLLACLSICLFICASHPPDQTKNDGPEIPYTNCLRVYIFYRRRHDFGLKLSEKDICNWRCFKKNVKIFGHGRQIWIIGQKLCFCFSGKSVLFNMEGACIKLFKGQPFCPNRFKES